MDEAIRKYKPFFILWLCHLVYFLLDFFLVRNLHWGFILFFSWLYVPFQLLTFIPKLIAQNFYGVDYSAFGDSFSVFFFHHLHALILYSIILAIILWYRKKVLSRLG